MDVGMGADANSAVAAMPPRVIGQGVKLLDPGCPFGHFDCAKISRQREVVAMRWEGGGEGGCASRLSMTDQLHAQWSGAYGGSAADF